MARGLWGTAGAIALAVAVLMLAHLPRHARISGAASVGPSGRGHAVYAADTMEAPGEDAALSAVELARRRREYAGAFLISSGILLAAIAMTTIFRNREAAAAGIAALAAVGIAALLQFSASRGLPTLLWPPPRLWLGTFAADFSLAVMFAAIGGTMMRPGVRRVMGSIVIAEIAWWGIPALAGATGLTLSMARSTLDMDWLVFLGTAVGAIAAPAAGWATASLAAIIAERVVPDRA